MLRPRSWIDHRCCFKHKAIGPTIIRRKWSSLRMRKATSFLAVSMMPRQLFVKLTCLFFRSWKLFSKRCSFLTFEKILTDIVFIRLSFQKVCLFQSSPASKVKFEEEDDVIILPEYVPITPEPTPIAAIPAAAEQSRTDTPKRAMPQTKKTSAVKVEAKPTLVVWLILNFS